MEALDLVLKARRLERILESESFVTFDEHEVSLVHSTADKSVSNLHPHQTVTTIRVS